MEPNDYQDMHNAFEKYLGKKYICSVCGYTHEGSVPPEKCPVCLSSASEFSEIQEEAVVEDVDEEAKDKSVDSNNIFNSGLNHVVNDEVSRTHEEDKSIKEEEKPCKLPNLNKQIDGQLDPDEEAIINKFHDTHGGILQVVKWYKEEKGIDLKEAKDRVEEVLIKHNFWNRDKIGGGCVVTILVAITSTLSVFLLL